MNDEHTLIILQRTSVELCAALVANPKPAIPATLITHCLHDATHASAGFTVVPPTIVRTENGLLQRLARNTGMNQTQVDAVVLVVQAHSDMVAATEQYDSQAVENAVQREVIAITAQRHGGKIFATRIPFDRDAEDNIIIDPANALHEERTSDETLGVWWSFYEQGKRFGGVDYIEALRQKAIERRN